MTRAGYERAWLQNQQHSLQVEQQLLRSDLLLRHNKESVQRWAEQHGFSRASATPLVVHAEVAERP
jgi:AraC-like DNA-binding protein